MTNFLLAETCYLNHVLEFRSHAYNLYLPLDRCVMDDKLLDRTGTTLATDVFLFIGDDP